MKLARDDRSCLCLVVEGALDVTTEIIGLINFNFCSEGLEFMTSFAAWLVVGFVVALMGGSRLLTLKFLMTLKGLTLSYSAVYGKVLLPSCLLVDFSLSWVELLRSGGCLKFGPFCCVCPPWPWLIYCCYCSCSCVNVWYSSERSIYCYGRVALIYLIMASENWLSRSRVSPEN